MKALQEHSSVQPLGSGGNLYRFQSQLSGGLTYQVLVLKVGVGNKPLLLREKLWICEIPPDCGGPHWGWGFGESTSQSLLLTLALFSLDVKWLFN